MECYRIFDDMLEQTHLLVAGATGSGKSVVINGMIYNGLFKSPDEFKMILIDPKKIELRKYRNMPHTMKYACEPKDMIDALKYAEAIMQRRFTRMEYKETTCYKGSHVYVIIDEWADLMLTNKKEVAPIVQRLAQLGRAARVHVILATQTPISKVLPTEIKCNFDSRVGLRTRSAQDSRNIMEESGLEKLPRYGECIYRTPESEGKYTVPMYSDDTIQYMVDIWTGRRTVPAA